MPWAFIEKTVNIDCVFDNLEWVSFAYKAWEFLSFLFVSIDMNSLSIMSSFLNFAQTFKSCQKHPRKFRNSLTFTVKTTSPKRLSNKRKSDSAKRSSTPNIKFKAQPKKSFTIYYRHQLFHSILIQIFMEFFHAPTHAQDFQPPKRSSQHRNNSVTILNDGWWKDIRQ